MRRLASAPRACASRASHDGAYVRTMVSPIHSPAVAVVVGALRGDELRAALDARGVLLNAYAEQLLADAPLATSVEEVVIVERCVTDLGFLAGATLPQIFARAEQLGLALCPALTAPYLRLAMADQPSASDSVLNSGRAPSGSLTVASPAPRAEDEYPKGFYLRVIEGRPWLRGYRCDDQHVWSPQDRFAFRCP